MPEERKLISVLFADIVGSTAITVARDAEVVRTALRRTFDELRPVIERHGGTVEKFIGDEVMAVFGVPTAHDDDAERAVRAAFAIRARVRELNAASTGIALELRIGINSGEAVAGTGEGGQFLVTGEPVIAAARIRAGAEPGEILVGALTHRITKDDVVFAEARTIDAKGLGPLEVWPARSLRSDAPEPHRGIQGLHSPLIGRDAELRVLKEALARVGSERTPSLVTVYGAAGAGKTRLIAEFTDALTGERIRFGRCLPYGEGITFYPMQQILRGELGLDLTGSRADALATLRSAVSSEFASDDADAIVRRISVVLGLAQAREMLPDVGDQDVMEELRWGVRRYLERRATAPLILVFEDLHWAEQALVDLIEHLAEWSRAPLLIVCLARPDFRDQRPAFAANAANAAAITLSPLGPDDSRRLIHELLKIEALPESMRTEIVSRAEGNPLYVEEFLRTLIETGRVSQRDGRWAAAGDIGSVEVPPTLQGLITARLDRVAPEVKRLLQSASIVGRLFSASALAAIAGVRAGPELLREAARRDLIVEADERAPGEGRVHRFRHALFREVAYSTIPKADRARMHDNYARWLDATLGERADEVAELVAYHTEQAYRYAAELGNADAADLGARALAQLVQVADRARTHDDHRASWNLYERAAVIAEATSAAAPTRAHVAGYALLRRLDFTPWTDESDRQLDEAIAFARSAGPSEVLVSLVLSKAVRAGQMEEDEEAKRLTFELADLARATGDFDLMSRILAECGERAYWWGDRALEERFYLEALEAGRHGARPQSIAGPLSRLAGRARRFEGNFTKAAEYDREWDALEKGTSLIQRTRALRALSGRAWSLGDLATARRHGLDALAAAHAGAPPWLIAFSELDAACAILEQGDDDATARELLEHGAMLVARMQARAFMPEFMAPAAIACLRLGDIRSARRHLAAAKEALLPTDLESAAITAVAEAELASHDGDFGVAEHVLAEALTRIEPSGYGFHIAKLRMALGRTLIAGGHGREAREQLLKAREFFKDPLARGWQDRIDALLERCQAVTD